MQDKKAAKRGQGDQVGSSGVKWGQVGAKAEEKISKLQLYQIFIASINDLTVF